LGSGSKISYIIVDRENSFLITHCMDRIKQTAHAEKSETRRMQQLKGQTINAVVIQGWTKTIYSRAANSK